MKTLITFVLLFLAVATVLAQWSTDPAVNTILDKPGDQRAPLITTDGNGGAIVAWNEDGGVFVNWIDRFGLRKWSSDGVRVTPEGRLAALTNIIGDGNGGAVIAWEDLTNAREVGNEVVRIIENEMFVQRVDGSGQLMWDADGVGIRTNIDTTTIGAFGLVSSDFEEFIFLWTDDRRHVLTNGALSDFYAQKVDSQGRILWDENGKLITVHEALNNVRHRILADNVGGFLLARFGEGNGNTVVERVSTEGELLWQPGGVSVNTGGAFEMDSDGKDGAVITGRYFPGSGVIQTRVQRINSSGMLLWGDSATVVTDGGDLDTSPRIVSDGADGAYIYWDANDGNGERKGFLQHLDSSGNPSSASFPTRYNVTSTTHPIFISDGQRGMILLAIDFFETPEWDFWAVKADLAGNLPWSAQGIRFRQRPFNDWPFFFDVVDDGSGGFIAVWEEFQNNTFWDIVLQQVSANGRLGEVITSVELASEFNPPDEYILFQNYPNPFNPETTLRFTLKNSGFVSLTIFDLTGKEVIELLNKKLSAGEHRLAWNGLDKTNEPIASGIYFYRLQANEFKAVRKMIYIR